ncbi:MAG: DNA repair protein RecO [Candidatus Levyibacteriota bacterium]
MQYIKDTGYVIKRFNFSEADKYITILTQDNGKIDVLAKGVRKLTSKRASHLEPLNKISFQAVARGRDGRYVLADTQLLESHTKLKNTLDQMKVLFTICELISVLCPQGENQKEVFFLLNTTLQGMGEASSSYQFIMQSFQIKLLSLLGYWDARHAFVDVEDVTRFTENIMERKLHSSEFFRS